MYIWPIYTPGLLATYWDIDIALQAPVVEPMWYFVGTGKPGISAPGSCILDYVEPARENRTCMENGDHEEAYMWPTTLGSIYT